MSEELFILKKVCRCLEEAKIPYMLTGSFAANFYAIPRMTRDIDFVIEIFAFDIDTYSQIFGSDFYLSQEALKSAIAQQGMFNIIHNETLIKIDFIIRKDSLYRRTEFQRKQRIKLEDTFIWIVCPEDLIISKLFWAKESLSEMQVKDVANLLSTLKDLDYKYMDQWIHELGLGHVYEKVKIHV